MFTSTNQQLHVSQLEIDPRIQRPLVMAKVNKIVKNFNPAALGTITISHRANGALINIDGQTRAKAVSELALGGDHDGMVTCEVFKGLELKDEAEMFLLLNESTTPVLLEKFRIRLAAEDPVALGINKALAYYGWKIGREVQPATINAVAAVERLWRLSEARSIEPNLVQQTVIVVSRAWGTDRYGGSAPVFEGIGRVLAEYGSQIDLENLISKLANYRGGPASLLSDARQRANLENTKVSMQVAYLVVGEYNRQKRVNTLTGWRFRG